MTQPNRESATSTRKRTLSLESLRAMSRLERRACQCGEMLPALFEIAVLIEGRAGRRKQNRVPGTRRLSRARHCSFHGFRALGRHHVPESALDQRSGFPDRENQPDDAAHRRHYRRIISKLVAPAENEDDAARAISFERLARRI